jgi:nucleoside-diphosphate-sugar epimerase
VRGARILVTGAAGFIGRHLCARLLADGASVHALVRPTTDVAPLAPLSGIAVERVDLSDRAAVEALAARLEPDIVFHLASGDHRRPADGLSDARNAIAEGPALFVDLLAALAAAPRPPAALVRGASLAEYGPIATPYREDQREEPADSHAAGAMAATRFGAMLAARLPFATVSARLALIYGPGQSARFLVPSLIRRLMAGHPAHVARPTDRRDLMHVDDAVEGLIAVARKPASPVVNLCTGQGPTMRAVAEAIAAELGAPPTLLSFGPADPPGGTPTLIGAPEAAARGCGWQARIPLAEGLARTIEAERQAAAAEVLAC